VPSLDRPFAHAKLLGQLLGGEVIGEDDAHRRCVTGREERGSGYRLRCIGITRKGDE
jgi:hypothetical protein